MHSITFAQRSFPSAGGREIRITEKVDKEGVAVYSRRRSLYKVILKEVKIPVEKLKLKPEVYIYRNIQQKRKFYSWRVRGIVKLPWGRRKSCLLAYEHSFWILIRDKLEE